MTNDIAALIERLLAPRKEWPIDGTPDPTCLEAAETLSRLSASPVPIECTSETGITIGLIDMAHLLRGRDLCSEDIQEALRDLRENGHVKIMFDGPPLSEKQLARIEALRAKAHASPLPDEIAGLIEEVLSPRSADHEGRAKRIAAALERLARQIKRAAQREHEALMAADQEMRKIASFIEPHWQGAGAKLEANDIAALIERIDATLEHGGDVRPLLSDIREALSASLLPKDRTEWLRLADDLEAGELSDLDAHQTAIVVRALRAKAPAPDQKSLDDAAADRR